MELRHGYKQTEIGVIPENWGVCQLGDLKPFVTSGSRGWADYYSPSGDLFVRITNLSRRSIYLDLRDCRFVRLPEGNSEGVRTQLREGDVLVSITADIGVIGYVDGRIPSPAYINQHIALLRFDAALVDGKFICYFLASEGPQRVFLASTDTGAKAGMSLAGVQKILTALPPTPEQSAIATALSDVDALLAAQDALIAKKRAIKQGAMQELLTGKRRLPGFSGEWEVKRLGEIAQLSKVGINPSETPEELFTHFSLPAFDAGERPVVESGASIGSNKFVVPQAAVLLSKLNPRIPRVWAPTEVPENSVCSTEFLVLLPREFVERDFFLYLCRSNIVSAQMELHAIGTTGSHQRIHPNQALAIEVIVPVNAKEQLAIAGLLSDMDSELAALEAQRAKTGLIKQSMMQELLTGRIRLV